MTDKLDIYRSTANTWGETRFTGEFPSGQSFSFSTNSLCDVYSNSFAVVAVQRGAAFLTTWSMIDRKSKPTAPFRHSGLCGIALSDGNYNNKPPVSFRAGAGETLTATFGPQDLVVEADNGGSIRELHRVPLTNVAATRSESPLPEHAGPVLIGPEMTRILLPGS